MSTSAAGWKSCEYFDTLLVCVRATCWHSFGGSAHRDGFDLETACGVSKKKWRRVERRCRSTAIARSTMQLQAHRLQLWCPSAIDTEKQRRICIGIAPRREGIDLVTYPAWTSFCLSFYRLSVLSAAGKTYFRLASCCVLSFFPPCSHVCFRGLQFYANKNVFCPSDVQNQRLIRWHCRFKEVQKRTDYSGNSFGASSPWIHWQENT